MKLPLIPLLFCLPALHAVEIRVATYNVRLGIEADGQPGRDAMEATLARIDADVVNLQEVNAPDRPTILADLASDLGYPHVFVPSSALDTGNRVIFLSKFPFSETTSILSPAGANDVTRAHPAVTIDVPGTDNDPVMIGAHLKCCFEEDDPFRRAVEMIRIRKYLESENLTADDNVFIMGDLNLLGGNMTFTSLPTGLPASYVLGNDITPGTFNVSYFANPVDYFPSELGIVNPGYRQQNGTSTATFMGGSTVLDHLLVSSAVAARMPLTEIYNSQLESSFPGLPKSGSPLSSGTSATASDHYLVYGDFELDGSQELILAANPSTLPENTTNATLTLTRPVPFTSALTVTVMSSDVTELILETGSATFAAGQATAMITFSTPLDGLSDGDQTIQLLASGGGFQGSTAVTVQDIDPNLYRFTDDNPAIIENFDGFAGNETPTAWTADGAIWRGPADGSSSVQGARSYEGSIGALTASELTFSAAVRNDSSNTIDTLSISYEASQWSALDDGSLDRWEVSLDRNGNLTPLPELTFTSVNSGPAIDLALPIRQTLSTQISGLNLAPGEDATLILKAVPGQAGGGGQSSAVFINEFHYDNSSQDMGEFVEIAVAPGFNGDLSQATLYLYNGNGGSIYDSHPLDTFMMGQSEAGYQFLTKEIPGIQNGEPDGLALVIGDSVVQFISYEGTFEATDGPATGLTSTSVGVSQGNGPVGQESLALLGSGLDADDFTWSVQSGSFTNGRRNTGQTFIQNSLPQGIGFDQLVITALTEIEPPQPVLVLNGETAELTFPTVIGRQYRVETSTNLDFWNEGTIFDGDGNSVTRSFSMGETMFFRVLIFVP